MNKLLLFFILLYANTSFASSSFDIKNITYPKNFTEDNLIATCEMPTDNENNYFLNKKSINNLLFFEKENVLYIFLEKNNKFKNINNKNNLYKKKNYISWYRHQIKLNTKNNIYYFNFFNNEIGKPILSVLSADLNKKTLLQTNSFVSMCNYINFKKILK
jgi:hypothetical protein